LPSCNSTRGESNGMRRRICENDGCASRKRRTWPGGSGFLWMHQVHALHLWSEAFSLRWHGRRTIRTNEETHGSNKGTLRKDKTATAERHHAVREVRNQIFRDSKTPMVFSKALTEAFQASNITLKENELFECTISIRERPSNVAELLSLSKAKGVPPMNFITDSTTMAKVLKEIQKDRIK